MLNPARNVLPGVWQITLPLPFELSSVNVYLIELRHGWMLVDCGLATADSYRELKRGMEQAGVRLDDIAEILLTHTHPDHVGQARRLLAETGARLSLSLDEQTQLHRAALSSDQPEWLDHVLHQAGVPADMIERIERSFAMIKPNFQPLTPHRTLEAGQTIEARCGELRTLLTPGHSPGHICLYSEGHRTLFCGDTVLETITPNIGWLPQRDALGEFFTSLEQVGGLFADHLLPGHGTPFSGLRGWIEQTRRHHDLRCGQLLAALAGGPKTAHEMVPSVWPRPLAPFHHRFAVFEVLAHLEYLRRRDRVFSEQADGALMWRV
jgi:glyoxylase-like metal-dependent hydrolase (beta-lactamase superfamily II)